MVGFRDKPRKVSKEKNVKYRPKISKVWNSSVTLCFATFFPSFLDNFIFKCHLRFHHLLSSVSLEVYTIAFSSWLWKFSQLFYGYPCPFLFECTSCKDQRFGSLFTPVFLPTLTSRLPVTPASFTMKQQNLFGYIFSTSR